MSIEKPEIPIKLSGFNNLTKALSFSLYDFCVARNIAERDSYVKYVYENFNAKRISETLRGICKIIDAKVLGVSDQDYEPWGASSMVLLSDLHSDKKTEANDFSPSFSPSFPSNIGASSSMHLDKSHICAHTYPDFTGHGNICSMRIDIEITTCGEITPLEALDFMFERFESDVVVIDYIVRGFTRDSSGQKIYLDHDVRSIRDYISPETLSEYECQDLSLPAANFWQTKLLRTNLDESSYFVDRPKANTPDISKWIQAVTEEMNNVFLKQQR